MRHNADNQFTISLSGGYKMTNDSRAENDCHGCEVESSESWKLGREQSIRVLRIIPADNGE